MSNSMFGTSPPTFPALVGHSNNQPHLSYYISRTNGTFVPLMPADELPFNIRLQGVPRVLNSDQIFGLQHIATLPFTGATFKVEEDRMMQRSSSQPGAPAHERSNSGPDMQIARHSDVVVIRPRSSHNTPTQVMDVPRSTPAHETATNWRKPTTSDPQTVIDAIVRTKSGEEAATKLGYNRRPLPPSGKEPDQEKKEYCTHWIRCGECDYMQQGCLYKHEMPDKATLNRIGFRSTPRWWLEKTRPRVIEGARATGTVGPIVKPAVWLKTRKAESAELSSSDGEVLDSESSDEEVVSKGQVSKKPVTKKNVPTRQTKPAPPQQTTIAESSKRKESMAGNLINFEPLIPAPASLSSTPSTASCSSSGESEHNGKAKQGSLPPPFVPAKHDHRKPKAQVFVPAGEDREAHIADAKAKADRKRARLAAKKAKTQQGPVTEAQVQVQVQIPKPKHVENGLMASKHAHENGLMASRHAPPNMEDLQIVRVKKAHRHRRTDSAQP